MKKKIFLATIFVIVIITIIGIISGTRTVTEYFVYETDKISEDVRIVQLSDIHSIDDQEIYKDLTRQINEINPDIIMLTGDIITNEDDVLTLNFIDSLEGEKYFVSGNHEFDNGQEFYEQVVTDLTSIGINIVDDTAFIYNDEINIIGVCDYKGAYVSTNPNDEMAIKEINNLANKYIKDDLYNIFLMHRPHYYPEVSVNNVDLFLSGHVHGGQWQLFDWFAAGGPDQGIFPEYFQGEYEQNDSIMLVSPGLEHKYKIPRIYNPRAIYVIDLVAK